MKRFANITSMLLLLIVCAMSVSCGRAPKETAMVADSTQIILKDTMLLNSEMNVTVESGIVLEHVRWIYNMVKSESMNLGGSVENDLLDRAYCSKSWNKLLAEVRRKEFRTYNLFSEVNHWTMAYDTNLVSFDEFEVRNCYIGPNNERTASVLFTVYTSDTYMPVRIDLVYEDGQWKIDNFHNLKYMLNLKESMWNFVHSNRSYLI